MTAREVYALVERNRRRNGRPDFPVGVALGAVAGVLWALWIVGAI